MVEAAAEVILSQTGAVGAMLLLTIAAVVGLWRSNVQNSDRFADQVEKTSDKLISHLERVHEADIKSRDANTHVLTTLAERINALGNELREHDRYTTILAMGARPAGGSEPGEDLSTDA